MSARHPFGLMRLPEGCFREIGVYVRDDGRLLKIFADPFDNEWYEDPMDRMPYRIEEVEPKPYPMPETKIFSMKFEYGDCDGAL